MEKFSYFLHRDGCTLYFAVLEQPEKWRGNVPVGMLSWAGSEGAVYSSESPEIVEDAVFLRGADRDMDLQISRSDFKTEQDAIEKEVQVQRLLAEFVEAGGFSGKLNSPVTLGVVTTFAV